MTINITPPDEHAPVPVRPAATVMLLRDGARGLEVCMLRRNLKSDFVGGAYVFPGGAVDPADGEPDVALLCNGRTDIDASASLGLPRNGLAFWVAAIRESFEEAGLLLAHGSDGSPLRFEDPAIIKRFAVHRRAVDHGDRRLVEICADEQLHLTVGTMHYFGHWVTPAGAPRRYDTRFFLAAAPEGQRPVQDDREVISAEWISPEEAIDRHKAGSFAMLPPTVASLRSLRVFASTADALGAAAQVTEIPAMIPRVIADSGGVRIVMPGDADYDKGYAGDDSLTSWPGLGERSGTTWGTASPTGTVPIGMPDIDATGGQVVT